MTVPSPPADWSTNPPWLPSSGIATMAASVILNKRAVMILPSGIDKASGLKTALQQPDIPPAQVVGIGDADQSLLTTCGLGVAVANALPSLKTMAAWVTHQERGGRGARMN